MEDYLKECGFKNVNGNFVFKRNDKFYPTISCRTRTKENEDGSSCVSFYFVLHFNPVVGSYRVERPFTWNVDRKKFLEDCLGRELGSCFTIPNSLLQKVQNSRSKSQKPWKKRNYPIAFSKKVVYNILKVDIQSSRKTSLDSLKTSLDNDVIPPSIQLCIDNMKALERKAALNNSLEPFIVWLDEYKKFKRYLKGRKSSFIDVSGRFNEDKAFEIFKSRVEELKSRR